MSRALVHFPYERRGSTLFGPIHRPVARVALYSSVLHQWLTYTMVVDTGADYCVMPPSIALDLGIDLRHCEPHLVSGVGGTQRVLLHHRIPLRLGLWERIVPVGFVERENLPPLLGRYRCLDAFDLRFARFVTTFGTSVR